MNFMHVTKGRFYKKALNSMHTQTLNQISAKCTCACPLMTVRYHKRERAGYVVHVDVTGNS